MKRAGLLLQAALLAGCTAVGPDYSPPQMAVPGQFAEAESSAAAGDEQLASWWSGFDDPALTRLVELALVQNLDVEAATSRIAESRALERAAGAAAVPQVSAQASASRQRITSGSKGFQRWAGRTLMPTRLMVSTSPSDWSTRTASRTTERETFSSSSKCSASMTWPVGRVPPTIRVPRCSTARWWRLVDIVVSIVAHTPPGRQAACFGPVRHG